MDKIFIPRGISDKDPVRVYLYLKSSHVPGTMVKVLSSSVIDILEDDDSITLVKSDGHITYFLKTDLVYFDTEDVVSPEEIIT